MYVPTHFREDRLPVLHEAIRRFGFGTLVTHGPSGLEASHIPLLLDDSQGPFGALYGHLARPNPQWKGIGSGTPALAIFLGPNTYISPSWYPTKQETGKVVPTWNYLAIHAYGEVGTFDDPERMREHVTQLTRTHESARPAPWAVSDAPSEFIDSMLRGIVGVVIRITRLDGKWKMSQNRPGQDQASVLERLMGEGGPDQAAVADIIRNRLKEQA